MTTGRINQVTILNQPDASRWGKAPEETPRGERKLHRAGVARCTPGRRSKPTRTQESPSKPFKCPHWVPQAAVRGRAIGSLDHHARQHTPLRRRVANASQHPEADTGESTPPKGLAERWLSTNHPQAPERCLLTRGKAGLRVPRRGVAVPTVDERTRVDIASRHLGAKRAVTGRCEARSAQVGVSVHPRAGTRGVPYPPEGEDF